MRLWIMLIALLICGTALADMQEPCTPVSSGCRVTTLRFDDFEQEPFNWGGWGWCDEASMLGPDTAKSRSHCMGTVCESNYGPSADYRLTSIDFVLPSVGTGEALYLRYWQWYNISSEGSYPGPDYGAVLISANYGSWDTLVERFTGSLNSWGTGLATLTQYAGNTVKIRFVLSTNYLYQSIGWRIDDITIEKQTFGAYAGCDKTTCSGEAVQLNAMAGCGVMPLHYKWTPAAGLSADSVLNPIACPETTTTYLLTVTDSDDPPTILSDSVTITVIPVLQIQLLPLGLSDTIRYTPLCLDMRGLFDSCVWNGEKSNCSLCLSFDTNGTYPIVFAGFIGNCVYTADTSVVYIESSVQEDNSPILPNSLILNQNYPNPFNPSTVIDYSLPHKSHVTIGIYNILGVKVRTVLEEIQSRGDHSVVWDGTGEGGDAMPSGVYFYKLTADGKESKRKMVLLK
ncbi:MAG: T9SS type A sorting domain-containing protein [candidate division Zixibacteria bacterium]|nr:T9SS type A sorting domain-containing protein [candidate division Zixibacteria bacterium]